MAVFIVEHLRTSVCVDGMEAVGQIHLLPAGRVGSEACGPSGDDSGGQLPGKSSFTPNDSLIKSGRAEGVGGSRWEPNSGNIAADVSVMSCDKSGL